MCVSSVYEIAREGAGARVWARGSERENVCVLGNVGGGSWKRWCVISQSCSRVGPPSSCGVWFPKGASAYFKDLAVSSLSLQRACLGLICFYRRGVRISALPHLYSTIKMAHNVPRPSQRAIFLWGTPSSSCRPLCWLQLLTRFAISYLQAVRMSLLFMWRLNTLGILMSSWPIFGGLLQFPCQCVNPAREYAAIFQCYFLPKPSLDSA